MQRTIHSLLTTAARVYLRKIEVRGASHVPKVPAIYAGNHPSGLIDPIVVMSALPDKVFCSVAKASLFSAPVVSYLVKTMEAIPVAKADDGDSRLVNGRNIVIFPEGTCNSTPTIKSLKIGTAKMAFEVALNNGPRVPIVPLGLFYSSPSGNEFRGSVLVDVGRPITLTDEQVIRYEKGDRGARNELCAEG
ncbi:hypothetical protein TrVE_jg4630 [Triparma verrucosa]|uniref:Phospholipid/glycerol acyltransferase domain-containing protein n=1 Tax=Triparma verrucosa TaxID=1606542 RepID=A0A9W7F1F2_9STRA|nr:hypothetical protein TrVE_jg4630 [Triparma verrucosa]